MNLQLDEVNCLRKEIRIIRIILSEIICFCFKQHHIFGVIILIILISFLYKIIPSIFNDDLLLLCLFFSDLTCTFATALMNNTCYLLQCKGI